MRKSKSTNQLIDALNELANTPDPSEFIRGNEQKVELKFSVPESLALKIAQMIADELEFDAREQAHYRHMEMRERAKLSRLYHAQNVS